MASLSSAPPEILDQVLRALLDDVPIWRVLKLRRVNRASFSPRIIL